MSMGDRWRQLEDFGGRWLASFNGVPSRAVADFSQGGCGEDRASPRAIGEVHPQEFLAKRGKAVNGSPALEGGESWLRRLLIFAL